MVASRSMQWPVESPPGSWRVPDARRPEPDPVAQLAASWALLASDARPGERRPPVAGHLATILRKLAMVLRAEPFWPLAAQDLGRELVTSDLYGAEPADDGAGDVLGPMLRLLRHGAPWALGVVGPDGERRLTAALDEMVAGFVSGLSEQHRRERGPAGDPADHRRIRDGYLHAAVGLATVALDGSVLDMNPALCRMFDLPELDQPRPMSDFVHPDDLATALEWFGRLVDGRSDVIRVELRLVRSDARELWAHVTGSLVLGDDGRPSHVLSVVEDTTQRHLVRSRLRDADYREQLMRLPNRAVTEDWVRRAFSSVEAGRPARVGLCAIGLDDFHSVHATVGRQVADRLLLGVVGRLQLVAGSHLLTRTGADEFAVHVSDPESAAEVCRLADRMLAVLATPFDIDGQSFSISASIGVAERTTDLACPAGLLRAADVARHWAKALGGGRRVVFDHETDAVESIRFALLSELPGAIGRDEFRLVYQPLVRLTDGRVRGAEALVRWQHPEQGLIGPSQFIELAEHSGAIVPLGRWVLDAACTQAMAWRRELGEESPFVSVNVSPVQMAEAGWVQEVIGILESTGLPPQLLQLEITEQAVLGDEAVILEALYALRRAGVRLALDDFGTGYSSLVWLRRLPVHALKIDGSFIDGLRHPAADPVDSSIVRALIEMAHALDLEVTSEWVETATQSERLTAMGCDLGQGRWFGDAGPGGAVVAQWRRSIGD